MGFRALVLRGISVWVFGAIWAALAAPALAAETGQMSEPLVPGTRRPMPPVVNLTEWEARTRLSAPLYPSDGESLPLFEGGPVMTRTGDRLEITLGPDKSHGYVLAYYAPDSTLVKTETYNAKGVKITSTRYGIVRGIGRDKISGIVETESDYGETGHATEWEVSEPDPKSGARAQVVMTRYRLDESTGKRVETGRTRVDSAQLCTTGGGVLPDTTCTAIANVVQSTDAAGKCGATQGLSIEFAPQTGAASSTRTPTFAAAGGVCVDSACTVRTGSTQVCVLKTPECSPLNHSVEEVYRNTNCDPQPATFSSPTAEIGNCPSNREWIRPDTSGPNNAGIAELMKETVREGAQCLAALGSRRGGAAGTASALAAAGGGNAPSATNRAFMQTHFATRNAAMLLAIYSQNANTGGYVDPALQQWVNGNPGGATAANIGKVATGSFGPIKIACDSRAGAFTFANQDQRQADARARAEAVNGQLSAAMGLVPGASGWPLLMLRQPINLGDTSTPIGRKIRNDLKATLFHEMMHMLGYPHEDPYIPTYSACQVCCFPDGWQSPCSNRAAAQASACAMCAGDNGTTTRDPRYQTALPTFSANVCACTGLMTATKYTTSCPVRRR